MKGWINAAKTAGFIAVTLICCILVNRVLNTNNRKYDATDTEKADGSRVLFFGTSQAYYGVNPLDIWDQAGITSYNFSAPGQYIGTTYYVMKDVFKYQSPQVAVLDIESMSRPDELLTISNKLLSLPMISGWKNRYAMYQDVIEGEPIYFIPMFRYHNRWKELNREDSKHGVDILGAGEYLAIQDFTDQLPGEFNIGKADLGERELKYLNLILELTRKKGCELILLDMPGYSSDEVETLTREVRQWAVENQVAYCETNTPEAFAEMDLKAEDFGDQYHFNIRGRKKYSEYMGKWLAANRGLSSSKETAEEKRWKQSASFYRKLECDGFLKLETEMAAYFERLKQGDYTIAISLAGNYKEKDRDGRVRRILEDFGLDEASYENGGCFVRGRDGSWIFNSGGSLSYFWTKYLETDDLVIRGSTGTNEAGDVVPKIELTLGDGDQALVTDGINVVAYSHSRRELIRAVGFDADHDFTLVESR